MLLLPREINSYIIAHHLKLIHHEQTWKQRDKDDDAREV